MFLITTADQRFWKTEEPEGWTEHFNEYSISVLKKAGIKICPTAIRGFNDHKTDPFYLKRIMVGFRNILFPFKAWWRSDDY